MPIEVLYTQEQIAPGKWIISLENSNTAMALFKIKVKGKQNNFISDTYRYHNYTKGKIEADIESWAPNCIGYYDLYFTSYITDSKTEFEFLLNILPNIPEEVKEWLSNL